MNVKLPKQRETPNRDYQVSGREKQSHGADGLSKDAQVPSPRHVTGWGGRGLSQCLHFHMGPLGGPSMMAEIEKNLNASKEWLAE